MTLSLASIPANGIPADRLKKMRYMSRYAVAYRYRYAYDKMARKEARYCAAIDAASSIDHYASTRSPCYAALRMLVCHVIYHLPLIRRDYAARCFDADAAFCSWSPFDVMGNAY